MKICLAGPGAFGVKHLQAVDRIDGIEVASLVGDDPAGTAGVATQFGIPHWTTDLASVLTRADIAAVILATPTPLHFAQAQQCMRAGKHVLIEIPMANSLADAQRLCQLQQETGVVAMAGHVRRFNPSHRWVHQRIAAGELALQHLNVQTYFLRRSNLNALGQPRSWTDHLLWHHACHTVDLFQYQTGEIAAQVHALQGPRHPLLGIAMDMTIGLKAPSGALCTLALSFNNAGPFGSVFRYICDHGTYVASYDELSDSDGRPINVTQVDVAADGIELEDREFFAAIREGREPNSSIAQCLATMQTLDRIERSMAP